MGDEATTLETIKEAHGCRKAKRSLLFGTRWHQFEWGMGPDVPVQQEGNLLIQETTFGGPGEWWMYCIHCGYKLWSNKED